MGIGGRALISLTRRKLVLSPPRQLIWIDAAVADGRPPSNVLKAKLPLNDSFKRIQNFVAGEDKPSLVMVCVAISDWCLQWPILARSKSGGGR